MVIPTIFPPALSVVLGYRRASIAKQMTQTTHDANKGFIFDGYLQ